MYLDANQDASISNHLDKADPAVRVLVERLVEENDAADAADNAVVSVEQYLAELTTVLLRVLHAHLG